jgi:hypothetical protein
MCAQLLMPFVATVYSVSLNSAHVLENEKIVNSKHSLNWLQRQGSKASRFLTAKLNKSETISKKSCRLNVGNGNVKVEQQRDRHIDTLTNWHYYD